MEVQHYDNEIEYEELNPKILYFGCELEIEHKDISEKWAGCEKDSKYTDEYKNDVQEKANLIGKYFKKNCAFKYDSSLTGGFEIITKPMTYQEQKDFWNKDLFKVLTDNGFISYTAQCAGHHIHVTKELLTTLQLAKISKFIYSPKNYKFTRKIAQRFEEHQASYKHKRKKWKDIFAWYDKHTALNLCHDDTIEFRLFRGTLDYSAFHKNLEYVNALIKYCAPANTSLQEFGIWWNFMNFVENNSKEFPNLWQYCIDKKIANIDEWTKYLEDKEKNETINNEEVIL